MNFLRKNFWNIVIWGTIALFIGLYFSLAFNINVTTDEIFSLLTARMSIKDILALGTKDDHPPLHYLICFLIERIAPGNIKLQKLAAILPMLGTFLVIATILRKRIGNFQTFLILFFFGAVPCTMEYSVQIRMYSLSIFFITLCGIFAYLAFTEDRNTWWVLYALAGLLASYTVYFAFVEACIIVGILLFFTLAQRGKRPGLIKKWIITAIAMTVCYIPCLYLLYIRFNALSQSYFLPEISFEYIWTYFLWTFEIKRFPFVVYIYIFLMLWTFAAGIYLLVKKIDFAKVLGAFMAMLVCFGTVLIATIVSLVGETIYDPRYAIIEMMLLSIYFGVINASFIINVIKSGIVKYICSGLLLAFLLLSLIEQYAECYEMEYGVKTEETVAFFNQNLGENDYVVYNYQDMGYVYSFYFPEDRLYYVRDFDLGQDYEYVWFLSNLNEWPITDADCYEYWLIKEYIGLMEIDDNQFDVYRIRHNEIPKESIEQ